MAEASAAHGRPIAAPGLLLVASALLFSGMAVLAKRSAARLPGAEVAFVRFAIGGLCCAAAAARVPMRARNKRGLVLPSDPKRLPLRFELQPL